MQLRKVCSHPFLFDWPVDPRTGDNILDDELVGASGKMLVLDRLVTELFKRGHKVLLFSQFTTMLDIIEVRPKGRSYRVLDNALIHLHLGLGKRIQRLAALSNRWPFFTNGET